MKLAIFRGFIKSGTTKLVKHLIMALLWEF